MKFPRDLLIADRQGARTAAVLRQVSRAPWHQIIPLLIGLYCAGLLAQQARELDIGMIAATLRQVSPTQWIAGGLATVVSFWALGRYDVHIHSHCETEICAHQAAKAGICAIAISQVTGLAAIVGTAVRWKMLRPIPMRKAAGLTLWVSGVFLLGWGMTLALASALRGAPVPGWMLWLALAVALVLITISVSRLTWPRTSSQMSLPSLWSMARLGVLALVDLLAAALVLYVLLPTDISLGFGAFFPVFLLAFGAGLYSGTPGGVGPFELTLLSFLQDVPAEPILAAVIGFRLVYYALPACLAVGVLIKDHFRPSLVAIPPVQRSSPSRQATILAAARCAETALVKSNSGHLVDVEGSAWARVDTGQTWLYHLDPIGHVTPKGIGDLKRSARLHGRMTVLYKVSRPIAISARAAGWPLLHISDEAILVPDQFDLNTSTRRQLRRKLRHATKAGITVGRLHATRDLPAMQTLTNAWIAAHGRERGVSMGRFSANAVADQWIFGATLDGELVAFVTFHANRHQICLDLMRHGPDVPDGTMHMLICAAIEAARQTGVPQVSLAAAPVIENRNRASLPQKLSVWASRRSGGPGLRRFKSTFAPTWSPRYAAAPSLLQLGLGLLDIMRAVHWPDSIVKPTPHNS